MRRMLTKYTYAGLRTDIRVELANGQYRLAPNLRFDLWRRHNALGQLMHKFLTDEEILSIEIRAKAAQAGPWRSFAEGRDHTSGSSFIKTGEGEGRGEDIELIGATVDDQDFIAAARQDIPRLLDEIKELKKMLFKRVETNSLGQ